jgi:hypothetical protein
MNPAAHNSNVNNVARTAFYLPSMVQQPEQIKGEASRRYMHTIGRILRENKKN